MIDIKLNIHSGLKIFLHCLNRRKKVANRHIFFSNKNTAFKNWIVVLKHSFQVTSFSLMSQSDRKSLVIIISGLFSRGWSKFEQLPQILLVRELCSLASKSSLEGQHEKSTDFPILLNLWVATVSMTWRISGYSSTTSLKSSACRIKMSHKVFAVMLAVRLALVNKQISGIKAANTSVNNGSYRAAN